MSLTFQCPHCACAYALNDASAGTSLTCGQCGVQIQAPGASRVSPGKLTLRLPTHFGPQENDMTTLATAPTRFLSQVTRHIERTIGPSPMAFHEIISGDIHLDLHIVPPNLEPSAEHPYGRNFYTIATAGMSARPMNLRQDEADAPRHVELLMTLPADWPGLRPDGTLVQEQMLHEENWWPFRYLKMLARMPHEQNTFIGPGHTIPNGPGAEPFAPSTGFGCMVLLPSVLHPSAARLLVHDDVSIEFLALWPLYPIEMEYKLRFGMDALQAALARRHVTDLIDIHRPAVVPVS